MRGRCRDLLASLHKQLTRKSVLYPFPNPVGSWTLGSEAYNLILRFHADLCQKTDLLDYPIKLCGFCFLFSPLLGGLTSAPQNVVPGPEALGPPGSWLEMQLLRPYP